MFDSSPEPQFFRVSVVCEVVDDYSGEQVVQCGSTISRSYLLPLLIRPTISVNSVGGWRMA